MARMLSHVHADLVGGGSGAGSFSGGTAVDPYGTGLDASALLGGGGEGGWAGSNASGLGSAYSYSAGTGVDPASMMAYMQLMMPQATGSPSTGPIPGVYLYRPCTDTQW